MTLKKSNKSLNLVVLASGRGSNLQAIIDACKNNQLSSKIIGVISNNSNAKALDRARSNNISALSISSKNKDQLSYNKELLSVLKNLNPDLIVLAGYMKILPMNIVSAFEGKIINIHPSLLPSFTGLNAQAQAIKAGVKITGCTVHFVDTGLDSGPIIMQDSEHVLNDDDENSLSNRLLVKEHKLLVKTIKLIEENKVILQENKTLVLS